MCCTCIRAQNMSRMIQLRHVSEALHRTLKSRAATAGMSLPIEVVQNGDHELSKKSSKIVPLGATFCKKPYRLASSTEQLKLVPRKV